MKRSYRSIVFLAVIALLAATLVGCGGSDPADQPGTAAPGTVELTPITVGASPVPHAEILAEVKDALTAQGYDLEITEFTDYVIPNTAVESGEIDANFFQHQPYLDDFNAEKGTHLVSVAAIHFEPLAIYAGQTASIDALADGATVAVPNDATNEARALLLLEQAGLITVDPAAGVKATPQDITANPKNLKFVEVEAAAVPRQLSDVDIAVVNGNYALDAGLDASTILETEDPTGLAATTYANILVVKEGNEDDPGVQALVKALQSVDVKNFIESKYNGQVVPVF